MTPQPERAQAAGRGQHLIRYDGVCGLCNELNAFVLLRDQAGTFDFASLQSQAARTVLAPFDVNPGDLTTLYVVTNYRSASPELLSRSAAALAVAAALPGGWRWLAVLRWCPRVLRDLAYDLVARNRYRWFGRYETCLVPSAADRARFIDV